MGRAIIGMNEIEFIPTDMTLPASLVDGEQFERALKKPGGIASQMEIIRDRASQMPTLIRTFEASVALRMRVLAQTSPVKLGRQVPTLLPLVRQMDDAKAAGHAYAAMKTVAGLGRLPIGALVDAYNRADLLVLGQADIDLLATAVRASSGGKKYLSSAFSKARPLVLDNLVECTELFGRESVKLQDVLGVTQEGRRTLRALGR